MWERNSPSFLNSRYLAVGVQQRAHREGFLQRRKEVSTGDTGSRALGRPGGLCGVISSVGFFFFIVKASCPGGSSGRWTQALGVSGYPVLYYARAQRNSNHILWRPPQ